MKSNDIVETIVHLVAQRANLDLSAISCDLNFFEEGWVDSLAMFRLILDIEKAIGIKLPMYETCLDNLTTINGLVQAFLNVEDKKPI